LRRSAWLLALSPLLFVAVVLAFAATLSGSGVNDFGDITRDQMDSVRVGWVLMWPVYAAAVLFGLSGLVVLNRALGAMVARWLVTASQVIAAVSAAAILANLVLNELAAGFDETRLGLNTTYTASLVASYASIWAAIVATILTALCLNRSGVLRRTGLVVAALAVVTLVLEAIFRGLPPFTVALFWLIIGIGLLRRRVPSSM
jgi:hypothetical protein